LNNTSSLTSSTRWANSGRTLWVSHAFNSALRFASVTNSMPQRISASVTVLVFSGKAGLDYFRPHFAIAAARRSYGIAYTRLPLMPVIVSAFASALITDSSAASTTA
jgi:hypothetical protein